MPSEELHRHPGHLRYVLRIPAGSVTTTGADLTLAGLHPVTLPFYDLYH